MQAPPGNRSSRKQLKQTCPAVPAHDRDQHRAELPRFIKDEFDAFLECVIPAQNFLRLRRRECGHDNLLAFSGAASTKRAARKLPVTTVG